jgi:glycosyltransferase involved in cell wall biosynthesis
MRIALVSDAWRPQINGVVRTLETTVGKLRSRGYTVETVTPDQFRSIPCPSYPEIRLAIGSGREVARRLTGFGADAVHIATEGPLGWAARRWCLDQRMPFSTSFHTRFPDYVALRTGLPPSWFWPVVRRFHAPAATIMTATKMLAEELAGQRLPQTHRWSRGVDLDLFTPAAPRLAAMMGLPHPIQLYVGRVAVEKNIDAFLDAPVNGSKVVVGDGPARAQLQQRYPMVHFLGPLHGAELASAYASADVFVFPSRTDTFGLVMIEALATGTPVAGFPVHGPLDIIGEAEGRIGAMDEDLGVAIRKALTAQPAACAAEGRRYSWDACTDQFVAGLCVNATMDLRRAA